MSFEKQCFKIFSTSLGTSTESPKLNFYIFSHVVQFEIAVSEISASSLCKIAALLNDLH